MLKMFGTALINLCCEPALAQWSTLISLAVGHQGRLTPESVSPAGPLSALIFFCTESRTREAFKFYMHHYIYAI